MILGNEKFSLLQNTSFKLARKAFEASLQILILIVMVIDLLVFIL